MSFCLISQCLSHSFCDNVPAGGRCNGLDLFSSSLFQSISLIRKLHASWTRNPVSAKVSKKARSRSPRSLSFLDADKGKTISSTKLRTRSTLVVENLGNWTGALRVRCFNKSCIRGRLIFESSILTKYFKKRTTAPTYSYSVVGVIALRCRINLDIRSSVIVIVEDFSGLIFTFNKTFLNSFNAFPYVKAVLSLRVSLIN